MVCPILEETLMWVLNNQLNAIGKFDDVTIPVVVLFTIIHFPSYMDFQSLEALYKFIFIAGIRYTFYSSNNYQMICVYHVLNNLIFAIVSWLNLRNNSKIA